MVLNINNKNLHCLLTHLLNQNYKLNYLFLLYHFVHYLNLFFLFLSHLYFLYLNK